MDKITIVTNKIIAFLNAEYLLPSNFVDDKRKLLAESMEITCTKDIDLHPEFELFAQTAKQLTNHKFQNWL